MAFPISCGGCGASFNIPDEIYQRRVAGRLVTIKCKHCQAPIQVDGRKPILEKEMEEVLRENNGDLVFKGKINKRVKVEESPTFQQAITEYDPKGASAKEFKSVVGEILKKLQASQK